MQVTKNDVGDFEFEKSVITIPAGKCPIEWKGTTTRHLLRWARNVINSAPEGYTYAISVPMYWVKDFVECPSEEWKRIRQFIKDNEYRIIYTEDEESEDVD